MDGRRLLAYALIAVMVAIVGAWLALARRRRREHDRRMRGYPPR